MTSSGKTIPEVYLTRLLATKGTLKKFIGDFLNVVNGVEGRFPCSLKWLFDLFDEIGYSSAAGPYSAQTLKLNAVHQGLWATLLRNPDLIYDVERTKAVDGNLSVVARVISAAIDAETEGDEQQQGSSKEATSHQLLFAKEISDFRRRQVDYMSEVRGLPRLSESEFGFHMAQLSAKHQGLFNAAAALEEISIYVRDNWAGLSAVGGDVLAQRILMSEEQVEPAENDYQMVNEC